MTCLHEEIKTWYFEDTNQPAGMWSCKSCGHKFFPLKLWVGLTDEEGAEIWGDAHDIRRKRLVPPKEIVRRIEAKLKEKNGG